MEPYKEETTRKVERLKKLIQNYPNIPVNIRGVILDYIGETSESIDLILKKNYRIYEDIFLDKSKQDKGKLLLRAICGDTAQRENLINTCKDRFPIISKLLEESKSATLKNGKGVELKLIDMLIFEPEVIVWQLSDIHFGYLNMLEANPNELAYKLVKGCADFEAIKPDIIIISGDLTTEANDLEFKHFSTFARTLSIELWGEFKPQRFLVVPGNHDIRWTEAYKVDKLRKFQKTFLKESDVFITPFGDKGDSFEDGNVNLKRFNLNNKRVPPFATIKYKNYNFEILLLISSYFSGEIPEPIRLIFENLKNLPNSHRIKELAKLIREDKGAISNEYLATLSKHLKKKNQFTKFAVIHHHFCRYGETPCANEKAPEVLQTLFRRNFYLLLHGHVHLTERNYAFDREVKTDRSYPVPCTSLTSHCFLESRGFNIHFLGENSEKRFMTTAFWPISVNGFFDPKLISPEFKFRISKDNLELI